MHVPILVCISTPRDNHSDVLLQPRPKSGTKKRGRLAIRTAILLGAGSSVAAGLPSTQCLTDVVLSGYGVRRHTDESYLINGADPPTGEALFAKRVAVRIHSHAKRYFCKYVGRRTNYEDLFYIARQVSDELYGEIENPAILKFIGELETEISPFIEEAKVAGCHNIHSFGALVRETRNYIADIVWNRLSIQPNSRSHLDVIAHACKSVNIISISTLCHDTHAETFLRERGISLSDGFSEPRAEVKYWNGDFYVSEAVPFLKLHGSVNWFSFSRQSGSTYDGGICIPLKSDPEHMYTEDGELLRLGNGGRPLLLIGTFNKIYAYTSGIYGELHHRFRATISEADQMVICGYSFGDKGINIAIIEWFYDRPGRRLVIIHPAPDSLLAGARPAIQRVWTDEWKKCNSISTIEKRLEDVRIDEFSEAIGN